MRTERILIQPGHLDYNECKKISRLSKNLFNQALYYKRQAFFRAEMLPFANLDQMMKNHHYALYDALPNAGSQAIIKKLCTDFDAFWAALNDWKIHPEKYQAKPQIPRYKKAQGLKTFLIPAKPLAVKDSHVVLPKKLGINPVFSRFLTNKKTNENSCVFKEFRIVPQGSCFWFEIVYDETKTQGNLKKEIKLDPDKHLAIDMGIDVLMAITSDQAGFQPVLVNGRPIKSINQYFNKQKARLMRQNKMKKIDKLSIKRYCQINDYFHKCANHVLQLCLMQDIGTVIIGKNKAWKQDINIGKVNNQKFVSIPHGKLIEQLTYKLAAIGVVVIEQEESYTSKADALALDHLPIYEEGVKHTFSGKREKRGLYQSATGCLLHADINGSLNILRKVSGDGFIQNLVRSGSVFLPSYWTPNSPVIKNLATRTVSPFSLNLSTL